MMFGTNIKSCIKSTQHKLLHTQMGQDQKNMILNHLDKANTEIYEIQEKFGELEKELKMSEGCLNSMTQMWKDLKELYDDEQKYAEIGKAAMVVMWSDNFNGMTVDDLLRIYNSYDDKEERLKEVEQYRNEVNND